MRWVVRIIVALVLTPLLWGLIGAYHDGSLGNVLAPVLLGVARFLELVFSGQFSAIPGLLQSGVDTLAAAAHQLPGVGASLLPTYLYATIPALALIVLVLTPLELLLKAIGLDLLIVVLDPLVAFLLVLAMVTFLADERVQMLAGSLGLAACYGLVFGLTIREPRPASRVPRQSRR